MQRDTPIRIVLPDGGFLRSEAVAAVKTSGLVALLEGNAASPFGHSSVELQVLESLVEAVDLALLSHHTIQGVLLSELAEPNSFELSSLAPAHHNLLAATLLVVLADAAVSRITQFCPVPDVDGALELDGMAELLSATDPGNLAERALRIVSAYVAQKLDATQSPNKLGTAIAAALKLLHNAVILYAKTGTLHPLVATLAMRKLSIGGVPYTGLIAQPATEAPSGLLPIVADDIVGNEDFLEAGLRLARDVAGFDFDSASNPKKLNPVLFGLGAPGCGKTITAHAVGNYFLDYCRQREIPARFLVVRRSDWASSYQNASASNLIRIFREEVHGFDGVCGVYWPDIDTALASRADRGLRSEEKQNLAAVFGVFDGTLLPNDGKWFMICDANTVHMDEAAISRIAQNPITVTGPQTSADYARMMRDIMLRDVSEFVDANDGEWEQIGSAALGHSLSGRSAGAICGNVRSHIQDFEYPDEYFTASSEERQEMIRSLSRKVDAAFVLNAIEKYARFSLETQQRDEAKQFETEVKTVVRQLNAGRVALDRATSEVKISD